MRPMGDAWDSRIGNETAENANEEENFIVRGTVDLHEANEMRLGRIDLFTLAVSGNFCCTE